MNTYLYKTIFLLTVFFATVSCSDFLEVSQSDELPKDEVVTNVKEASAALNGIYTLMKSASYYGCDLVTYGDVRGDDMGTMAAGDRTASQYTYGHTTSLTSTNAGSFWEYGYRMLGRCNSLLERINAGAVQTSSDAEKAQLNDIKAQALTLRALLHFDLVRIYGEPYLKNKDAWGVIKADRVINKEEQLARVSVKDIYSFMVSDLTDAIGTTEKPNLSEDKKNGYINLWAAKSLLAKIYLYMGEYKKSYDLAEDVINGGVYSLIAGSDYVRSWGEAFSSEAIFELYTSDVENADRESIGYVLSPDGYAASGSTQELFDLLNEDPKDYRLKLATKKEGEDKKIRYFINKYPGREGNLYVNNPHIIRLSEVYLIAAEAGAYVNEANAKKYLDDLRKERRISTTESPFVPTPESVSGGVLVDLVKVERRKELFGEGHRFFDITRDLGTKTMKRTGTPTFPLNNDIYVKEIGWNNDYSYLLILPIPSEEKDNNAVIQQNEGYLN